MIRKAPPPAPVLSGDGAVVACLTAAGIAFVTTLDGSISEVELPYRPNALDLSRHGFAAAIGGTAAVSSLRLAGPPRLAGSRPSPGPVAAIAGGDDGLLAAIVRVSQDDTALCWWRGDDLTPGFDGSGHPLGALSPFGLSLDEDEAIVYLWALTGPRARDGIGDRAVRIFKLHERSAEPLLDDSDTQLAPATLFPLGRGEFVAHEGDRLSVLGVPSGSGGSVVERDSMQLEGAENVVASPGGTRLAYIHATWDGVRDRYGIRVVDLESGEVGPDTAIDELGQFPALAVDDSGRAALAYGVEPDRLVVLQVDDKGVRQVVDLALPQE